ncbi:NYN domain-containing protein, partial [Methanomethylovorans sp.]|uniref:NYN domain-containing protein n=1 Tax=Methanomethylovorans sp. TaxID=2758717 RepID=UPI003D0A547E
TLALVTRDADFKPLLSKANENGKETILFGVEPGFSAALRNSADYVIILENNQMNFYDDDFYTNAPEKSQHPAEIEAIPE